MLELHCGHNLGRVARDGYGRLVCPQNPGCEAGGAGVGAENLRFPTEDVLERRGWMIEGWMMWLK